MGGLGLGVALTLNCCYAAARALGMGVGSCNVLSDASHTGIYTFIPSGGLCDSLGCGAYGTFAMAHHGV